MSSIDIVNNEKSLYDEKFNEEQELQKSEEAKNKVEMELEIARQALAEKEQEIEKYRKRRWWKSFAAGLAQTSVAFVLFIALFYSSWDYFNNANSILMRDAVMDQLMSSCTNTHEGWSKPAEPVCPLVDGVAPDWDPFAAILDYLKKSGLHREHGTEEEDHMTCDTSHKVIYLKTRVDALKIMLKFQERIQDPENYFFQNNKLLPWAQVAAYRTKEIPCLFAREDSNEVQESVLHDELHNCYSGLYDNDWDQEDFEGSPYQHLGGPTVRLHSISFSQAGNIKNVRIGTSVDADGTIRDFNKSLTEEIFCKDWMGKNTKIFSISYNFFNIQTGIFMDAKIVFVQTDQGTYYIEVDTNRFTTSVGQDREQKHMLILLGVLANLINMIVTFRKIKEERMQKRMLTAYLQQEEEAKDGEKKNAEEVDEEDFEEEQFDLTDGEY